MICVNTNRLLINHHGGYFQIIYSSLIVLESVCLSLHRNDSAVWMVENVSGTKSARTHGRNEEDGKRREKQNKRNKNEESSE